MRASGCLSLSPPRAADASVAPACFGCCQSTVSTPVFRPDPAVLGRARLCRRACRVPTPTSQRPLGAAHHWPDASVSAHALARIRRWSPSSSVCHLPLSARQRPWLVGAPWAVPLSPPRRPRRPTRSATSSRHRGACFARRRSTRSTRRSTSASVSSALSSARPSSMCVDAQG